MVDLNTARAGARRKTGVLEFQGSASKGTSEVVLGLGVAARKAGASEPQDGVNLCRGGAAAQQLFGDPEIGDAPIGLGEALRDAQALQEALIDGGRRNRCEGGDRFRRGNGGWTSCGGRSPEGWRGRGRQLALGCREESGAVGCQLRLSMDEFDPGSVAVGMKPGGFAIGEAGQPTHVSPIGTGPVGVIAVGQVLGDGGRQGGWERSWADTDPGLETAGASLEDDAGVVSVCAHDVNQAGGGGVEIDQDVAGVLLVGIGTEVDVEALAVTEAQEADHAATGKLKAGPQRLSGEGFSREAIDQTELLEIAGHRRELYANGLQGDEESAVHDRGIAWTTEASRQKRNFLLCWRQELSTLP